jgi:hypothetical protein
MLTLTAWLPSPGKQAPLSTGRDSPRERHGRDGSITAPRPVDLTSGIRSHTARAAAAYKPRSRGSQRGSLLPRANKTALLLLKLRSLLGYQERSLSAFSSGHGDDADEDAEMRCWAQVCVCLFSSCFVSIQLQLWISAGLVEISLSSRCSFQLKLATFDVFFLLLISRWIMSIWKFHNPSEALTLVSFSTQPVLKFKIF